MTDRNMIQVLDKGFVTLVDHMGDDQRIVQAARVSYGEGSKGEEKDKKLIRYLMGHGHTSPFEQPHFTFLVKAPIFVFRQWHRHRMWSYNEVSARYTELEDEYYVPTEWRAQDTKNKQGSIKAVVNEFAAEYVGFENASDKTTETYTWITQLSFKLYKQLLDKGVAREMARMVLPLSTYTSMYASVDLHNLLHFLKLRLDTHAQYEIRCYAEAMKELITPIVPWTMEIWKELNDKAAPE